MVSEILREIFKYLDDDRNGIIESRFSQAFLNLKSCILVNREWCDNAMPLLWKQPFHRCLKSRSISLIRTLLSCLNDNEIQDLYNNGFRLPSSFFKTNDKFQYAPSYSYSSFLKNLDYYQLINFVKRCFKGEGDDNNNEKYIEILLRALLKHFAKRSSGLSSLNIRSNGMDDAKYMILLEPDVQPLIKPLKTLTISCHFSIDSLVSGLSRICKFLTTLKISNLSYDDEITSLTARQLGVLIENQKSLECLQLVRCKSAINLLIPSILKQRRALKKITMRSIDFYGVDKLDILRNSKLEQLEIIDSYNLDYNIVQPLLSSNQRKLKNVEVFHCKPENISRQLEEWAFLINNRRKRRYL